MNNCSSLTCNRRGWWGCGHHGNCHNTCGCTASDGTPACNPYAPWGTANTCGNGCGGTCGCNNNWGCGNWSCGGACSVCGNIPCTCGS